MPFDASLPEPPPAPGSQKERWSERPQGILPQPRNIQPLSDREVLYQVLLGIRGKWARRLNGGDGTHCIVGWVVHCSEPMTVIDFSRPQTARLLQRLHDALPKSAQRKREEPHITLGRYNDTHDRVSVYRVAERAWLKLVDDMVNEANRAA